MAGYRYEPEHRPPPAEDVTDVAITRFPGVYEVQPSLMLDHVTQQTFPNWDTLRIVHSRHDHLAWMHKHWADEVVSGAELLDELSDDAAPQKPSAQTQRHRTPPVEEAPHADQ